MWRTFAIPTAAGSRYRGLPGAVRLTKPQDVVLAWLSYLTRTLSNRIELPRNAVPDELN